jgi:hypothetical protein
MPATISKEGVCLSIACLNAHRSLQSSIMRSSIGPGKVSWFIFLFFSGAVICGAGTVFGAHSAAGAINLTRTYHPDRTMVYDAEITTHILMRSDAPALDSLMADIPRVIRIRLKNTLTVEKVLPDGSADIRDRLDALQLLTQPKGEDGNAQSRIDADANQQITGQVLTVRYDHNGNLLGITGAEPMLQKLASPTRNVARLALRALFSQFGGNGLYPGHPLRLADTWRSKAVTSVDTVLPASFQIERTFQYKGNTRYHGVKAATVEFQFADSLTPATDGHNTGSLLSLLKARGVSLAFTMTGSGAGSALIALSNGRILQKYATFHENLHASLKGVPSTDSSGSGVATVDVSAQSSIEINLD